MTPFNFIFVFICIFDKWIYNAFQLTRWYWFDRGQSLLFSQSIVCVCRDHFWYRLSQWETMVHCNVVSHWLCPSPEWSPVCDGTVWRRQFGAGLCRPLIFRPTMYTSPAKQYAGKLAGKWSPWSAPFQQDFSTPKTLSGSRKSSWCQLCSPRRLLSWHSAVQPVPIKLALRQLSVFSVY